MAEAPWNLGAGAGDDNQGAPRGSRLFKEDTVVAFARWLVRRRWLVIVGCLVAGVLLASGGRFLGFSTDYRVFFSKENPQLTAFEALQNVYTKDDTILVVVKPRDGDIFVPRVLSILGIHFALVSPTFGFRGCDDRRLGPCRGPARAAPPAGAVGRKAGHEPANGGD